jgi:hypothetical protein
MRIRSSRRLVLVQRCVAITAILMAIGRAGADDSYLREMPTPERVLAEIQGSDSADTQAKQWGAFYQLKDMITSLAHFRPSPAELQLNKIYLDAMGRLEQPKFDEEETRRLGMSSSRAKWFALRTHYELDRGFRNEIIERLVPRGSALWQFHMAFPGLAPADSKAAPLFAGALPPIYVFLAYASLLVFAMVYTLAGPFGLGDTDPHRLLSGRTHYQLHTDTGTVLSPTQAMEVRTHVSGGGNTAVTSSTSTNTHLQFFIKNDAGGERAIQGVNLGLAVREGQGMSVVWGIRDGQKTGKYILFRNHATMQLLYMDEAMREMLRRRAWLVVLLSVPLLFLPLIPYFIVRKVLVAARLRRLKRQIEERLVPDLDQIGRRPSMEAAATV